MSLPSARRLLEQVLGAAGASLWLAALGLVTTPYLLPRLGDSAYGVFAMVAIVSAHLSNLELGFGQATIRFLARAQSLGDRAGATAVLDTSLCVFAAGGALGGLALFGSSPFLTRSLFAIPAALQPEALTAFRLGGLILACSFLTSLWYAALQALGRFAALNGARVVFGTLSAGAAVAVVAAGGGVGAVFRAQAVVALLSAAASGLLVARARGERPRLRADPRTLRQMGAFAALVFLGGIAYQWMINGPPLVLAARLEAAELPAFSVPQNALQRFGVLIQAASLAFYPFASAAGARDEHGALNDVFRSHLRLTVLTLGPILAFLGAFAEPLLRLWIGPDFARASAPCLRLLAAATLVLGLSGAPADLARAMGRPAWVLAYTGVVAGLGTGLSFALVGSLRAPGVALGFLLAMLAGTLPFLAWVAWRLGGLTPAGLLRALAGPGAAVSGALAAWGALERLVDGIVPILASGLVVSAAYAVVVLGLVLEPREREAVVQTLRRA